MNVLNKEEIERFGFIYEPDKSKCRSCKLKLRLPESEYFNEWFKESIAGEIPFVYVHLVKETENPYAEDPNFLADPKIMVIGHTRKERY
jgi:hypothetical protein